ncbi:MAG: FAD:protein FMN transferase [Verrucomicrobia bacterium]|nr:FAD:protein FMN transferase [Verrucomicrobiota bacterium]
MLAGCQTSPLHPPAKEIRRAQPLLGTFVVISAIGTNSPSVHRAIDLAFDAVREVDALMSLHRADSELVRLNASASEGPVAVSEELFRVISFAQEVSRQTDGSFDVTIRPVADLWGFIWKQHRLPTDAELEKALTNVGHQRVELDPVRRTVRFNRPGFDRLGWDRKGICCRFRHHDLAQARRCRRDGAGWRGPAGDRFSTRAGGLGSAAGRSGSPR